MSGVARHYQDRKCPNGMRFQRTANIQGFLDVVIGLHRTYENRLRRMASIVAAEVRDWLDSTQSY